MRSQTAPSTNSTAANTTPSATPTKADRQLSNSVPDITRTDENGKVVKNKCIVFMVIHNIRCSLNSETFYTNCTHVL